MKNLQYLLQIGYQWDYMLNDEKCHELNYNIFIFYNYYIMRIKEIYIKNFRSIKEETIKFPENWILALVWPNNAWKSNILKAIDNVLWDSWFSKDKAEKNDYWMRNIDNKIRISIQFSENNALALIDFNESWWSEYKENNRKIWIEEEKTYKKAKDVFPCTYLSANRDLEKNLQFRSYELMWKIAKAFNDRITSQTKENLERKFWEILEEFGNVDWFNSFTDDFTRYFDELQSDAQYKIKVDFKAFTPLNYFKTINIQASDLSIDDKNSIDLVELWEWNKSLVLFALIRSYAKNFKKEASWILAVEEPEIYLHPQARRHLFQIFKEIVSESDIQIIYTTHSPDFVSTENFSSIWLVSKDPTEWTKVKMVSEKVLVDFCISSWVPEGKTNVNNIREFYATTSNFKLNEWFFAKHLILVEWDTEELCFPLLFQKLWLDYYSSWISIIWVEWKNQIPKYWRLFKSFGIPVSVIIDSDTDWNDSKNVAKCFWCTEDDIISNVDLIKQIETEKQKIYVLEKDFETVLRKSFNNDNVFDSYFNDAINIIKPIMKKWKPDQQKWQIARYICKRILEETDFIPDFLNDLYLDIINN